MSGVHPTVAVTGATGFLGRHLVDLLLSRGTQIRALVRRQIDARELRLRGVEVVRGDIAIDEHVRDVVAGCEVVYHLAGVVSHRRRDHALLQRVNVEGTRRLLAAVEPATRVVHVSSVAAIGTVSSPEQRAGEAHFFPPAIVRLPYAASKHAGEQVALAAVDRGAEVVVANPGFLLGPGDLHRVSTWPVDAYLAGRLRFSTAGGLAFVDVRDVAHGLVALAERGRTGERMILASEEGNLSWRDFFGLLAQVSGVHRRMLPLPRPAALAAAGLAPWLVSADEVRAASHWWFVSPAKARHELAFSTRPIRDTLADTIADHASVLAPAAP